MQHTRHTCQPSLDIYLMALLLIVIIVVVLAAGRRPHADGARARGAPVSLGVGPTAAAGAADPLPRRSLLLPHYLIVLLKQSTIERPRENVLMIPT